MIELRRRLTRLTRNLWWAWNSDLDRVFRAIDADRWRAVNHNPVAFLRDVEALALSQRQADPHLIAGIVRAEKALDDYLRNDEHWASRHVPGLGAFPVAYFSPEFALHESLPVYSGGLGILAGDHLKSCSDLGIPAFGVGLLYKHGYFTQQVDAKGRQQEVYGDFDPRRTAIERVQVGQDAPLTVEVTVADKPVTVAVWQTYVGRCRLLLLEPKIDSDAGLLRLYGGDRATRIAQEIVLGVGGYRVLRALGVKPGVIHLNEGHSAFAVLEAIRERVERSASSFEQVAPEVSESVVFTTHTPVDAGHDRFAPDLALRYLAPLREALDLTERAFLGLGRVDTRDDDEPFCMTTLAIKLARRTNAVSSLHAFTSRKMWHRLWPERRVTDVPLGHITNGAHMHTWMAHELGQLYADCLGSDWRQHLCHEDRWRAIDGLDELSLWTVKLALKQRLLGFAHRREIARRSRLGLTDPLPQPRPELLTIGFARRFAAYKRVLLLFDDYARAKRLLTDPERPVQLLVAGKAHPADEAGKKLLQRLYEISREPEMRDHVILVEDHDMNVSRHLLEGCDLWLNAPRRPLEACGTSGMKAVFNATLHCSTLDGWWDEAYDGHNGFAYGDAFAHAEPDVQDRHDAQSLLQVLEQEVVPLYYDRTDGDVPLGWLRRVKYALKTLAWRYNSDRMVMDYALHTYRPASMTATAEVRAG